MTHMNEESFQSMANDINLDHEKCQNETFLAEELLKKKNAHNTPTKFVNAFTNVGYVTSKKIVDFMQTSNKVILLKSNI